MYNLRFFEEKEYPIWNSFVESSPQGTIFSTTIWLDAIGCNYKVLGCFSGNQLVGGIAFAEKNIGPFRYTFVPKLTRYNGIIIRDCSDFNNMNRLTLQYEVIEEIIKFLRSRYNAINISNGINLKDVRPFMQSGFRIGVSYTYTVDLTDIKKTWERMKKKVRNGIRTAEKAFKVIIDNDISNVYEASRQVFERQNMQPSESLEEIKKLYSILAKEGRARIYSAKDEEGNLCGSQMVVRDAKSAYTLTGGVINRFRRYDVDSLISWTSFKDMSQYVSKIDLVGANIPSISEHKKRYGGTLEHYFEVDNSKLLKMLISGKRFLKKII